jgi:hypothetical protein
MASVQVAIAEVANLCLPDVPTKLHDRRGFVPTFVLMLLRTSNTWLFDVSEDVFSPIRNQKMYFQSIYPGVQPSVCQ